MDLKNKRILIAQPMLYYYCGTTVTTIELAEYLKKCGAEVEIYTYILTDLIKAEFDTRDIPVFDASNDPVLDLFSYDIVWIHSQTFPESMVWQLSKASENWDQAPLFIFLHMSSSAELAFDEFPWIYKFEDTLADKILYISEKVESTHRDSFEEDIPFAFFRNPAPTGYLQTNNKDKLNKVLIVSNHVPPEIQQAAKILSSNGIQVDFFGRNRDHYRLVQPDDIKNYDSVITIGKTVQYCILSETPVYIYDRFGGPGYLSGNNYEESKQWHFSGRGFEKRSAEEIASEIQENWGEALAYIKKIKETESDLYRLDNVVDSIFSVLEKRKKNNTISHGQELAVFYGQRMGKHCFVTQYNRNKEIERRKTEAEQLNKEIERLKKEIKRKKTETERLRNYITTVENSPSLKIGKIVTYLPKKCKEVIHGKPEREIKKAYHKIKSIIRPQKICLVTCVYNEERNLPTYLKHIEPYVDFIAMLDDGSTDNTKEILRSSPKLRLLIERPMKTEVGEWNETDNHEELLKKVKDLGADWVLALDPDERLEKGFLENLRSIIESSDKDTVFGLHMRALWSSYDHYRTDGLWGNRIQYRLFPLNREITYVINRQQLHYRWYPDSLLGHETKLDYSLYHLKTITPEARAKRAELYNSLDPQKVYQSIGYDFMTDETGLKLQKIPPEHQYDYNSVPPYILSSCSENEPDRTS